MDDDVQTSPAPDEVIVLEETDWVPSEADIQEYAEWAGVDLTTEAFLLPIVTAALVAPVPEPWKACRSGADIFYFNFTTGESEWEHPADEQCRVEIERARVAHNEEEEAVRKAEQEAAQEAAQARRAERRAQRHQQSLGSAPMAIEGVQRSQRMEQEHQARRVQAPPSVVIDCSKLQATNDPGMSSMQCLAHTSEQPPAWNGQVHTWSMGIAIDCASRGTGAARDSRPSIRPRSSDSTSGIVRRLRGGWAELLSAA